MARRLGLQDWITPRHFVHLVNRILAPDPPLAYNASWPHEHRLELRDGRLLSFEWSEDECRLVATLQRETRPFQHDGDAVGWLTLLGSEVQGTPASRRSLTEDG